MDNPRVVHYPRPGLSPEQTRDIRAYAWRYVFDCYAKKKGGVPSTADDGKEIQDVPAKSILPQQE